MACRMNHCTRGGACLHCHAGQASVSAELLQTPETAHAGIRGPTQKKPRPGGSQRARGFAKPWGTAVCCELVGFRVAEFCAPRIVAPLCQSRSAPRASQGPRRDAAIGPYPTPRPRAGRLRFRPLLATWTCACNFVGADQRSPHWGKGKTSPCPLLSCCLLPRRCFGRSQATRVRQGAPASSGKDRPKASG